MTGTQKIVRRVVFGLAMFVAAVGSAFILGETLTDPGGAAAIILIAAWVLPMVALSVFALRRPSPATTVMMVVAALVSLAVVLDEIFDVLPRDIGPVGSIAVFAVAVALGFLGLNRPLPAGSLLVLLGAALLGAAFSRTVGSGDGAPASAALSGSSGAVAVPVLVVGVLFLTTAGWESWLRHRSHRVRPAH